MSKNLTDLNELLFKQMEKLTDDNLTEKEIKAEIEKSQAITNVAETIIKNGELALKATVLKNKFPSNSPKVPEMLTDKGKNNV